MFSPLLNSFFRKGIHCLPICRTPPFGDRRLKFRASGQSLYDSSHQNNLCQNPKIFFSFGACHHEGRLEGLRILSFELPLGPGLPPPFPAPLPAKFERPGPPSFFFPGSFPRFCLSSTNVRSVPKCAGRPPPFPFLVGAVSGGSLADPASQLPPLHSSLEKRLGF